MAAMTPRPCWLLLQGWALQNIVENTNDQVPRAYGRMPPPSRVSGSSLLGSDAGGKVHRHAATKREAQTAPFRGGDPACGAGCGAVNPNIGLPTELHRAEHEGLRGDHERHEDHGGSRR